MENIEIKLYLNKDQLDWLRYGIDIINETRLKFYIEDEIRDSFNILNEQLSKHIIIKDKIKVYIKEQNMPEYIQLWDKFNKREVSKWVKNNTNTNYSSWITPTLMYVNDNNIEFTFDEIVKGDITKKRVLYNYHNESSNKEEFIIFKI